MNVKLGYVKLGWWAPWEITRPWMPNGWLGTDEWHNPAISVVLPFLGAFHIWFRNWSDGTEGHYSRTDAPDCPVCQALDNYDAPFPKGWWWNPPRPNEGL